MNIYSRYFRVTGGPLLDRARELGAAIDQARAALKCFCIEIGADDALCHRDGRLAGFVFAARPAADTWKQPNSFGAYWPRKNTAAGRAMLERVDVVPRIPQLSEALEVVGLQSGIPVMFSAHAGHCATLSGSVALGTLFVAVPWQERSPDEIAKYKLEREAGSRMSIELDHLCWKPTDDMVEIKRWELEKEIEELNAKIKARNAMAAALATAAEVQP